MKRYKVALIHNIISPYRVPLFEEINKDIYIELYVYFCAKTHKDRDWNLLQSRNCNYKILPDIGLNFFSINYHINPSIIHELIKNKYDAIIACGYDSFTTQVAFFLSKLKHVPFILWSGSTYNESSFVRKVSLPLVKFIIKHSDAYLAYGTRAKEYLIFLGASPEKVFISYNTIDTTFFKRQSLKLRNKKNELKNELGIKNKSVVLFVGRLIKVKNLEYLINAYSKLKEKKDVALLIVGDGPLREGLKDFCKTKNIKDVFFVGFKQKEELPKYYAVSDLFVLPSRQEVWGLVLNEAMASGLPVIATNKVGGSKDLIKEGLNGYIVESGNIKQLHDAMKKILSNPKLAKLMGEKSQELIDKKFTIKHAAKGFIFAIKNCLR